MKHLLNAVQQHYSHSYLIKNSILASDKNAENGNGRLEMLLRNLFGKTRSCDDVVGPASKCDHARVAKID